MPTSTELAGAEQRSISHSEERDASGEALATLFALQYLFSISHLLR